MDEVWPWLATLPPPGTGTASIPLAASPEAEGASIVLQADCTATADGGTAVVAFSIAVDSANGVARRVLWTSEPFAEGSEVAPRLLLLAQLLDEVTALSPSIPSLSRTPDASPSESKLLDAAVVAATGTDGSPFFSLALLMRLFWLCALEAPADLGFLFFQALGKDIERALAGCAPAALGALLLAVGPDVEERFMRSLGYMLAKWCLLREMQSAPKSPAKPDVACLTYATNVHGLWVLRGYAPVLAIPRIAGATSHSQTLAFRPAMSVAAAAVSLVASSSLSVPDHLRLRLPAPPLRFRRRSKNRPVLAVLEEKSSSALSEEEARKVGLNGSASRLGYDDAAVEAYLGSNGNGNGTSNRSASGSGNGASVNPVASGSGTSVVSGRGPGEDERRRKERVEEIGREDAWFKRSDGEAMPKVSVVPGGRWNRFKTYSTIQRTLEIWGSVFAFIFKVWLNNQKFTYRGGVTEEKRVMRRKVLAKWLKESILRLGPTFIKIGQQFSTRVDILPKEYVDQLSELQDQVPPFPSETAVSTIEEELGASVNEIFERFDVEPLAAASLGQVHRACLNGQEVVLKVQRPGLKELFDIDLKNLRVIAEYLQKVDPKSDGAKRDWVAIYDECANVLYQEIDYTKEAFNAEKFAENFKNMDYVKVPEIYWEYTTPQVLTMEYVPGIKINRIQQIDKLGLDRKRLGRYAVESYLEQILSHGFFHADPHPGNIAVDDANGGRLIFYDFGMMGSISPNIREGLLEVFYGVYEKDPDKVLQAMIQMGVLVPTGDMTAVRRTAQFFLDSFEERLAAQRKEREMETVEPGFKKQLSKEEKFEKKKQRLAAIGEDLLAIAADQPFRFPATFTFVVRAFSVLDGIGKGLDPRFDITEIAKPYAMELLRFNEAGVEVLVKDARKRWDRQSRAFYNVFRQPDRVEKLAQIIERLEQGDLKLRVRALESERSFQRVAAVQKTIGYGVAAGSLVNLATILHLNSIRMPATIAYSLCAFFGLQILLGVLKVKKLDQQERLITGTA